MKDIVTPVPQEDVKTVIRKCLVQAAMVNYQRLSEYAKLQGKKREMYEHPVFCLASQVMDLTIREYLPPFSHFTPRLPVHACFSFTDRMHAK
ncbi:calcium-dependent secretion activator 1-like [Nothobranchius furzeri]|uniref:Calcium-dependent secretion activator 1-like n=1 Tax=Nothobranchius furzeri TaxID=105023 RepID=A0A9D3BIT4_NOTFU|nr:calcium-dependent secretion activator 1-like [Nothobranchius furzeri]